MNDYPDRLRSILERLPLASKRVVIIPGDDYGWRYLAKVVSPQFRSMTDGDRQRLVWQLLFDSRDDIDLGRVEFVYTHPSEDSPESASPPAHEPIHANHG